MTPDTTTHTRREMLIKLAAASATAGVAATVVSSTAFADGGTINSLPNDIEDTFVSVAQATNGLTNTTLTVRPTVGIGPATCPFQTTPPTPNVPKIEYAWELVQATPLPNNNNPVSITSPTAGNFGPLQNVVITATGVNGNSSFVATFTLSLTVRWVCPQRPPRQPAVAWRCRKYSITLERIPNGTVNGFGPMTFDPNTTTCDSTPAPTLP